MVWVMEHAPIESPAEGMVLYALANCAKDDGTAAWPSMQWIADRACCSRQTVRRHLRALESRGVIRKGDQRHVDHIRPDKRPVVWNLNLFADRTAGVQNDTPNQAGYQPGPTGVSTATERGITRDTQTVLNPPEHSNPESDEPTDFDQFWQSYPRKVNRKAAEKAWTTAREQAPAAEIMSGLSGARLEWAGIETRWIPHPANWLRDGRWRDHAPAAERPTPERCDDCRDNNGFIQLFRGDGTPYVIRCRHDHN